MKEQEELEVKKVQLHKYLFLPCQKKIRHTQFQTLQVTLPKDKSFFQENCTREELHHLLMFFHPLAVRKIKVLVLARQEKTMQIQ